MQSEQRRRRVKTGDAARETSGSAIDPFGKAGDKDSEVSFFRVVRLILTTGHAKSTPSCRALPAVLPNMCITGTGGGSELNLWVDGR